MRGNEIINHIVRAEMPDMEQVRGKCVQQAISQEQHKQRPRSRSAFRLVATAVVVMCLLFGNMLLNPYGDNVFSVKAYAMEQQPDGSIGLREVDIMDQPDVWGGYTDGNVFYVSVGLKCEGENIKSVEFSTDEGFFAKEHIDDLKNSEDVMTLYVGAESRIAVYGKNFEKVGDKIMLDKDTLTDDLLLFWGTENNGLKNIPKKIDIQAKATFNDGRTDEQTITIDLSGTGLIAGSVPVSEEQRKQSKEQADYFKNIPLEQCELIPESVKTVTDVYEYEIGDSGVRFAIVENEMQFDENGIFRCGWWGTDEGWVISVIKRDSNGVLTGMTYKVPAQTD